MVKDKDAPTGEENPEEGTEESDFDSVNAEGIPVVNTPLNKYGLPDPKRVVTHAYREKDGTVSYKGG